VKTSPSLALRSSVKPKALAKSLKKTTMAL
jgi:hypothetical protein